MKVIKYTISILIIAFPLYLIIRYESNYLQKVSTSDIKSQLMRLKEELNRQYEDKHGYIVNTYSQVGRLNDARKQIMKNFIDRFQKDEDFMSKTIYKNKMIMNFLVSRQYIQQKEHVCEMITKLTQWFNSEYGVNWTIKVWKDDIQEDFSQIKEDIIIIFQELRYEYIDENIANKIRSGEYRHTYYLQSIAQQLRTLPMLAHCQYTHIKCTQKSFVIVNHPQQKSQTFWSVDKSIYFLDAIHPKMIFNALISALSLEQLAELNENNAQYIYLVKDIVKLKELKERLKIVDYLIFICQEDNFDMEKLIKKWKEEPSLAIKYIKNGQYLSPYYHTKEQLQSIKLIITALSDRGFEMKIEVNPLTIDKIGMIDIFPNDFKIGVYLPLAVIFMYPVFVKVQQSIAYLLQLFSLLGKKHKRE